MLPVILLVAMMISLGFDSPFRVATRMKVVDVMRSGFEVQNEMLGLTIYRSRINTSNRRQRFRQMSSIEEMSSACRRHTSFVGALIHHRHVGLFEVFGF